MLIWSFKTFDDRKKKLYGSLSSELEFQSKLSGGSYDEYVLALKGSIVSRSQLNKSMPLQSIHVDFQRKCNSQKNTNSRPNQVK